jgi:hypothetical protein
MPHLRRLPAPVATFLVEHYWPGVTVGAFKEAERRLAASVAAMRREGMEIRTVAATLVPSDEAAYWIVDGGSREAVARAFSAAGLQVERIVDALELRATHAVGPGLGEPRPDDDRSPTPDQVTAR